MTMTKERATAEHSLVLKIALYPRMSFLVASILGFDPPLSLSHFSKGTDYAFDWLLRTHPKDYSGEMEGKHSKTLKLSKVQLLELVQPLSLSLSVQTQSRVTEIECMTRAIYTVL